MGNMVVIIAGDAVAACRRLNEVVEKNADTITLAEVRAMRKQVREAEDWLRGVKKLIDTNPLDGPTAATTAPTAVQAAAPTAVQTAVPPPDPPPAPLDPDRTLIIDRSLQEPYPQEPYETAG